MDFFTAPHGSQNTSATVSPGVDPFAQEIGRRFSLPAGQPLLTTRLSPVATTVTSVSTPTRLGKLSLKSKPPSPISVPESSSDTRVTTVVPSTLSAVLNKQDVLVLDIRPHGIFTQSRLPHALSLSVPSTLLKRPAFSLEKITEMLPSSSGRRHFASWKSASRILVYDADSQSLPEGSNIRGLLRKFENEGFHGDLLWLKGGFSGVWRECRRLVDDGPPSPDVTSEEEDSSGGYLRAKRLPLSAFQQVSTTTASQRPPVRPVPVQSHHQVAPAPTFTRPVAANPFYDNIRQNRELAQGITERIPLRLPPAVVARRDELPFSWLRDIVDKSDVEEGTEALAMQFYMIELREQRRLMGVMDHHTREGGAPGPAFPYSITAGVEKGSKNRYTNIWPFEHARVRLNSSDIDDYINASHVQPLGTDRRYIATQGPLPTTYTDFWTLCWEQNIRIIIMLTKEIEGATVKCGPYWKETAYGPFRLQLTSSSDPPPSLDPPLAQGFDFGMLPHSADNAHATVRRSFLLSHSHHPGMPARHITQLQYTGWPDFDVPEDPRGLLNFMREVDVLREEEGPGPVLLHCSAGIGRTGGFIVVDAALDGIRRELRRRKMEKESPPRTFDIPFSSSPGPMDVDRRTLSPRAPSRQMQRDIGGTHSHHPQAFQQMRELRGESSSPRPTPNDGNGTDTSGGLLSDDSLSPVPPGTNSPLPMLRPSVFSPDLHARRSFYTDGELVSAVSRFRASAGLASGFGSASTSTTNLPSVFSTSFQQSTKSTTPTSFPVSVESSRSPSPAKDAESSAQTAFDYTDPRRLHSTLSPVPLSGFAEPVQKLLEDMREQRMSLCQSLRQYVFVHRAIVEGALDIIDEERGGPGARKRGASPTELEQGTVRLSKRPSTKRREPSSESPAR